MLHSPMNYTGGKAKIIGFLTTLFPKGINHFYDLFAGGLNVSLNTDCKTAVCNDINSRLMEVYKYISSFGTFDSLERNINETISQFGLHVGEEGIIEGAGSQDAVSREGYERLRDAYNDAQNPLYLLVLVFYSFNNCMRFNKDFKFNMPIGKSAYNMKNHNELHAMHAVFRKRCFQFTSKSFADFPVGIFQKDDFVYCDPPYLITNAVYNESNNDESGWGEDEERKLHAFLDGLDDHGILFGLSNAVNNNGKKNELLEQWMKKYHVFYPDIHYANASYHRISRERDTVEVYVTNYDVVDSRLSQLELF
ncbi:MAG: Dam family site-specific DNA-(adenine-N6)-methyltransferase [Clostridia bacterium]|nr:Dam family site-specific DNA-(adenine-N6)-methyltransferase [Clostridia bacterium]